MMARKKWLLILIVFTAVAQQQIYAACVCNARGEDACGCSGIVQPKPNHSKRPDFELPPVGDNCWCSKTVIKPASLPKPCSKSTNGASTCGSPAPALSPSYAVPEINYVHAKPKDNSPPADPISVSLAVQAGKAIEVPEAKLSYGFVRKPINRLPKVFISAIKEENLYGLANDVITLKKPTRTRLQNLENDYPELEEEEEEEHDSAANEDYAPPSLTYKQLGYEAEEFQNPEFVPMAYYAEPAEAAADDKQDMLDCAFKAKRIGKFSHIRKFEPNNHFVKN